LLTNFLEVFYGGAAGGGKSAALLMAALQYVDDAGYSALILRRTYADLRLSGALMDMAHQWLAGTKAVWNSQAHTWSFPSGATLTFGYLETENDKYRYASAEFQFIAFDELTQFTESQYRFLFSRLRKKERSKLPLRMRAASNPGGIGHDWVKQRFLIEGKQHNRIFVPAKLADNPFLNAAEYEKSLSNLDPITRAQLLNGDWSARSSAGFFRREWFKIVDAQPASLVAKVRYWDMAATVDGDWTAGVLMAKDKAGNFYILDVRRMKGTPQQVEHLIVQTAALDGKETKIIMEQEGGAAGVNLIDHYTRQLAGYNFHGDKVTGDKVTRAAPLSSQAQAGNIYLLRAGWNSEFLDELDAFPNGTHDDQVDAAAGAFQFCAAGLSDKQFEISWE
jgi:predicted phage terminase large subunit-like protein